MQRHPLLRELPPEARQRERGRTEIRSCPGEDLRSQIILPLDIETKRTGRRTKPSQSPRVTDTGPCGIEATSRPSQRAKQSVKRTSTTGCGTSTIGSTGEGDGTKGVEKTRETWKGEGVGCLIFSMKRWLCFLCHEKDERKYLGPRLPVFAIGLGGTRGAALFVVWPKRVVLCL